MSNITWTAPYYGVQHASASTTSASTNGRTSPSTRGHWCTVHDYGHSAGLSMWFPGCGFSPLHSDHPSAESAREAGEEWLGGVTK